MVTSQPIIQNIFPPLITHAFNGLSILWVCKWGWIYSTCLGYNHIPYKPFLTDYCESTFIHITNYGRYVTDILIVCYVVLQQPQQIKIIMYTVRLDLLWFGVDPLCAYDLGLLNWHWAIAWLTIASAVREITKSSSTFSATKICSNIIWFLQLHDTIKMKSNHTWINYNHNNIAIRSHIMIYSSV